MAIKNTITGFPTPTRDYYRVYVRSCTYNQASYIVDCLNGVVIQQTNFPFVHHVIDDCSTDGEQEVIKAWIERECDLETAEYYDNDICTITLAKNKSNPNYTIAAYFLKRNLFREKARKQELYKIWRDVCPYEAICEGDDYWIDSQKLQKQISFLDAHQDYAMCHTSYNAYHEKDKIISQSRDVFDNVGEKCKDNRYILKGYRLLTLTVVVRTEVLKQARQKDPFLFSGYFLMGDTNLWYEVSTFGKIHFMPDVTAMYRKNEGSVSRCADPAKMYKFRMSSAEMRLYISRRDNIGDDWINYFQCLFDKTLYDYRCFEPTYQSKLYDYHIQPNFFKRLFQNIGIMKLYLSVKFVVNRKIATLYRRLFKPQYTF